jgi:hypothetical protein
MAMADDHPSNELESREPTVEDFELDLFASARSFTIGERHSSFTQKSTCVGGISGSNYFFDDAQF